MCGIVAYLGDKEAQPLLLEGLRRLEYRGYDSSGIAVLNGNGLEITKKEGRIQQLESGRAEVENQYARMVRPEGNLPATCSCCVRWAQ